MQEWRMAELHRLEHENHCERLAILAERAELTKDRPALGSDDPDHRAFIQRLMKCAP
jgi:hypothetical protein